jgi:hypothetical protein
MELRRRAPRVTPKDWWGRWTVENEDSEPVWCECQVVDVSLLGVGVDLWTDREVVLLGERLVIEVRPPDGETVLLRFCGSVRWMRQQSTYNFRVGLEFERLSGAEQAIVKAIEQLQGRW